MTVSIQSNLTTGDHSTEQGAMKPERIQRKRTKGWKMPPNTVYVGRPTMWGNHAPIDDRENRAYTVAWFRDWALNEASWAWRGRAQIELRGKNLACWCKLGDPCHADVLLELANVEGARVTAQEPATDTPPS